MRDVDQVLGPELGRFVLWVKERGEPVPARPAAVVLAMLMLRGARMRGGLPEPTPNLVRQILCDDLPFLVAGSPEDLIDCPRVLVLLADQRRADGLLNAKRQAKLHAAVQDATADFHRAMADPSRLTWPRFYGRLLRADGVDPADADAVRGWLGAYRERPRVSRRADLTSALGVDADGEEGLTKYARAEAAMPGSDDAELAVQNLVVRHLLAGAGTGTGTGLARHEEGLSDEDIEKVTADAVDVLVDLGTAAGLSGALRGEFRDLTLRPGDTKAHELGETFSEACEEYDYHCLPPVAEIPADDVAAGVRSSPLLSAAAGLSAWVDEHGGVPAGAETAAGWHAARELGLSRHAREEVWHLATATGLLRTAGGRVVAGDSLDVWPDGSADEVTLLGLDAFGGVMAGLERLAEHPGLADDHVEMLRSLVDELPRTLINMFEGGDTPVSLARLAAEFELWKLGPGLLDAAEPPAPATDTDTSSGSGTATAGADTTASADTETADDAETGSDIVPPPAAGILGAQLRPPPAAPPTNDNQLELTLDAGIAASADIDYRLPPNTELERVLGVTDIDDEERSELLDVAYWQALVFDRLAALGMLRRDGDRAVLTPLGRALLRLAFILGGGDAPTTGDLRAVDATQMMGWLSRWPERAQVDGLTMWLDAHGGNEAAWRDLLLAASAREHTRGFFSMLGVRPDAGLPGRRPRPRVGLPSPLPNPEAETTLRTALGALVPDPTIGAYAAEALRLRGGQPAADPPWPAQAVWLFDRLHELILIAIRRDLLGYDDDYDGSGERGEIDETGERRGEAGAEQEPDGAEQEPDGAGAERDAGQRSPDAAAVSIGQESGSAELEPGVGGGGGQQPGESGAELVPGVGAEEPGVGGGQESGGADGERDATGWPSLDAVVCAEFDRAAAGWPGGYRELVRQLAAVAPARSHDVFEILADHHTDPMVAQAARTAILAPRATRATQQTRARKRAKPSADGRKPAGRKRTKKRRR